MIEILMMADMSQELCEDLIKRHIDTVTAPLIEEKMVHYPDSKSGYWQGNLYAITDLLIRDCGRYVDRHASDMLITLNHFLSCMESNDLDTKYFCFGLRENGVDGLGYLAANLRENPDKLSCGYYRKIYALEIQQTTNPIDNSPELRILLKDISGLSAYDIARRHNEIKKG